MFSGSYRPTGAVFHAEPGSLEWFLMDRYCLYATDARSPRHQAARSWLERQLAGDETIAFAWVVLLAFLRSTYEAAAMAGGWDRRALECREGEPAVCREVG